MLCELVTRPHGLFTQVVYAVSVSLTGIDTRLETSMFTHIFCCVYTSDALLWTSGDLPK